ncbi:MAG: hypothetical protein HC897_06810 [Thermoanaerobaculia bacterium]|nr:hypothetical protein [Thermoanaerobaculia bacterium]
MVKNRKKPSGLVEESGCSWRLLAHRASEEVSIENEGIFDELVLDNWLHLERMQDKLWWLRVGDARLMIELHDDGSVTLKVERGFYDVIGAPSGKVTPS